MNIRNFTIAVIIVLIFIVFMVVYMENVLKDSTPISTRATSSPAWDTGATEGGVPMSYSIPANAIPTPQELEDSAKKAEDRRTAYKELCAQIDKERLKRKAEQKDTQQNPPEMDAEKDQSDVLQDKNVILPTTEERKEMESRDIISF